jgi:hypothetical protein
MNGVKKMVGVELIAAERASQIERKGLDAGYTYNELVFAAVCYASPVQLYVKRGTPTSLYFGDPWPVSWGDNWDKRPTDMSGRPKVQTDEQRLRQLVKAGALIAAEIDRLQRYVAENAARLEMKTLSR